MEVITTKSFYKELNRIPKPIQKQINVVLDKLEISKSLEDSLLDYKKLRQSFRKSYYRIRVGDYRIGVEYISPKIIIITVLRRGDFYKHFPQQ